MTEHNIIVGHPNLAMWFWNVVPNGYCSGKLSGIEVMLWVPVGSILFSTYHHLLIYILLSLSNGA